MWTHAADKSPDYAFRRPPWEGLRTNRILSASGVVSPPITVRLNRPGFRGGSNS